MGYEETNYEHYDALGSTGHDITGALEFNKGATWEDALGEGACRMGVNPKESRTGNPLAMVNPYVPDAVAGAAALLGACLIDDVGRMVEKEDPAKMSRRLYQPALAAMDDRVTRTQG